MMSTPRTTSSLRVDDSMSCGPKIRIQSRNVLEDSGFRIEVLDSVARDRGFGSQGYSVFQARGPRFRIFGARGEILGEKTWSSTTAGRRLAKRPSSLRILRRPVSGRLSRGFPSHLGPPATQHILYQPRNQARAFTEWDFEVSERFVPMAARSTESDAFIWARVSSGQGSLQASRAAPPIKASFHSISNPCFLATACTRACADD
jgi:hypothetical protein